MSFFGKIFSSNSKEKSFDKYGDILKKVMTTKEQRSEAIEALEKLKPDQSIPQLLKRFEMVIDSGLLDNREKETCMKIIVSHGDAARNFIKDALASKRRIAWPIKIAEKIFPQDEYINLLLENLNPDMAVFDEDALERNTEILLALRDIQDEKIIEKAKLFLTCRNEDVRMAALECLEDQAAHFSKAKEILLDFMQTPLNDDNSRFVGVIHEIAKKHSWL